MFLTNRFFYIWGALIALFGLSYAIPIMLPLAKALFALSVALMIADGVLLFGRKPALAARRQVGELLSLSDLNPVALHLENHSPLTLDVSMIDELPVQLQCRDFNRQMRMPPRSADVIEYEIRPLTRGAYIFGNTHLFVTTFLGLIERRITIKQTEEVGVYPSIIQMKRYELRAMRQIAHETGIKKIRRLGHSYEFEQIKNYVTGDDYRSVNWKASGRRGALMVNQYEDERSQEVYCIVDKSRAMRMPFDGLSLMDYAINSTLALSNIILKKQDKAGLLSFSDVIGSTIKAERDTSQLRRILEALYRERERQGESNYELLYEAVRRLVTVRALLIVFTNFESNYALERALPTLRRLNRLHLVVVVFFENTEIRSISQLPVERTSDIYRQVVARQFLHEKKEMVSRLRQYGIQAVLTKPEDLTLHTINKYLELKSRGVI